MKKIIIHAIISGIISTAIRYALTALEDRWTCDSCRERVVLTVRTPSGVHRACAADADREYGRALAVLNPIIEREQERRSARNAGQQS